MNQATKLRRTLRAVHPTKESVKDGQAYGISTKNYIDARSMRITQMWQK